MEVQEFIDTCKSVFPDCEITGSRNKKNPCLKAFAYKTRGPYIAHLWKGGCCSWEKHEDFSQGNIKSPEELKLKLEKVKLSYGL